MSARTAVATAALVRDGRVLLAHRHPKRRWYPDCWDLVGGHVEAGESAEQAVIRECAEELGIGIRDPRPVAMTFTDPAIEMHAFVVGRWDGEPVNAAPEEHDRLRWFAPRELADLELADPASLLDIVELVRAERGTPGPNASTDGR